MPAKWIRSFYFTQVLNIHEGTRTQGWVIYLKVILLFERREFCHLLWVGDLRRIKIVLSKENLALRKEMLC